MRPLLIIPAAGTGSRLEASVPKLLVPVNGRPMIDHLLDLYAPHVDRVCLVVHPSAETAVRAHCARRPGAIEYDRQVVPTGMLDAILVPADRVRRSRSDSVWITWCDQVAVHPKTVDTLARLSRNQPGAALIFPTARRKSPYIHLVRNDANRIVDILHEREGDTMPEHGESDMGLFSLSRAAYLESLISFAATIETGAATRERNFLPFIPWMAARATVVTFPCQEPIEAVGVNTADDLRVVEAALKAREAPHLP